MIAAETFSHKSNRGLSAPTPIGFRRACGGSPPAKSNRGLSAPVLKRMEDRMKKKGYLLQFLRYSSVVTKVYVKVLQLC